MKNKLRIFSLVLVGLYSLVLVHNVIPHLHLNEISDERVHTTQAHGHVHHHHGADDNMDWVDLLLTILHDVSHQNMSESHCENYAAQDIAKIDSRQKIVLIAFAYALFDIGTPEINTPGLSFDPPPLLKDFKLSSSDPMRGPPTVA